VKRCEIFVKQMQDKAIHYSLPSGTVLFKHVHKCFCHHLISSQLYINIYCKYWFEDFNLFILLL